MFVPRFLAGLALLLPFGFAHAADFEFQDGDRVVLIGSTLIEREQRYGYWEAALTAANPTKNITFRNLGWSGDTVWGEARAGFGTQADGYKHLIDHVKAEKPTVIIVGYGTNESFAGNEGLDKFKQQYNRLLDDLAVNTARMVLLAPLQFEEATWKGTGFRQRQGDLALYTEAIREVASRRKATFVDEFCQRYGPASPMTDNGMHLTPFGYWQTASNLLSELRTRSAALKIVELDGVNSQTVTQLRLPNPPLPEPRTNGNLQADSLVIARNLKPGTYALQIDSRVAHVDDAEAWMKPPFKVGLHVLKGPSLQQAEQLRQTIIAKNELYFHRWRPQNVTYLFGFRKHEQGNNAREIPQFDPLIAAKEKEIAKLRVPREHVYELVPVKK